jgi:hypothetical protein
MKFRLWLENHTTQAIYRAYLKKPDPTLLLILADAMEEEGNPNAELLRSDALFDKKFLNWYGKTLLPRAYGQQGDVDNRPRQLTASEMQWAKSVMPKLRENLYSGAGIHGGSTSLMLLGHYFLEFLEMLVNGQRV